MIRGLVSTIIPVHNRPQMVREAVASVLAQTYDEVEVIIVDDGSDDPAMAESLVECKRMGLGKVHIVRQSNRGPGAARQHGLETANGEFFQFLDSDDLLLKKKFELQVAELTRDKEAGVCYGKTRYRTDEGNVIAPWRRTGERIDMMFPSMLAGRWWGTSTALYRRSVVTRAGPISNLRNEEDWEFDCRIGAQGVRLARVDEWVSEQRADALHRASSQGSTDLLKLTDRARARHLILDSAHAAGIPSDAPEFQIFIRYSFLVARQCASVGLDSEAEALVEHLNKAAPRAVMSLYLLAGRCLGFKRATRIAEHAHRTIHPSQWQKAAT